MVALVNSQVVSWEFVWYKYKYLVHKINFCGYFFYLMTSIRVWEYPLCKCIAPAVLVVIDSASKSRVRSYAKVAFLLYHADIYHSKANSEFLCMGKREHITFVSNHVMVSTRGYFNRSYLFFRP